MPCTAPDVLEDDLFRRSPELLGALLRDETKSFGGKPRNIFWATSDYEELGEGYGFFDPITPEKILGRRGALIRPRVLKSRQAQAGRSRGMAEVFTPAHVCCLQNNLVDDAWFGRPDVFCRLNGDGTWTTNPQKIAFPKNKDWKEYVRAVRLEISCGEAPYLVSRYDAATGELIPLQDRTGLLDRKMRVVNENAKTSAMWLGWAKKAFQSICGYEWQGDSLLIARENLLASFQDYYAAKFRREPEVEMLLDIAHVISWNLWQMDGLRGVIPGSCGLRPTGQVSLFGEPELAPCRGCATENLRAHNGTYCLVRDWSDHTVKCRVLRFVDLLQESSHAAER